MEDEIELKISEDIKIPGKHPVVIIGPNGSGKTRLGARLSQQNKGEWISAVRNLALAASIEMRAAKTAKNAVRSHINRLRDEPWRLAGEFELLISQLLAEDAESAKLYRNKCMTDPGGTPPDTKITKLVKFWNHLFPGREINLDTYTPMVTSILGGTKTEYPVYQMSDGERVAMYLTGRVINTDANIIIVDEPEVHFHSLLAKRFWNELETIRSECRFVYLTHDIRFALSRREAQFVIVEVGKEPRVLSRETNLPSEIFENILGAATFSVSAKRIVFCEGEVGGMDESLYSAWFQGQDTQVVPVGGCDEVVKSVEVFNSKQLIVGGIAVGIVDRDYRPDDYFASLDDSIHVLQVHELESLLCLKGVFRGVAKYLKIADSEIEQKYADFIKKVKGSFQGLLYNKQVLERAKQRGESEILKELNKVPPEEKLDDMKKRFLSAFGGKEPKVVFEEEESRVKQAINGSCDELLKVFPGKSYINHALRELGINRELFMNIIVKALSIPAEAKSTDQLVDLKRDLITTLEIHLPSRTVKGSSELIDSNAPEKDT